MSNSVLSKIAGLKMASAENMKVPMTEAQEKDLTTRLKADNRLNVYANKFDVKKPFRVQIRKGKEGYKTYGYFTDVDVAAAVGSIVSAAAFGEKALRGNYDQAKVEAHPEFQAWLIDERNQEVLNHFLG